MGGPLAVAEPACGPRPDRPYITHLFFSDSRADQEEAKDYCRGCDLRARCLQAALDRGEDDGIFGGFTPVERRLWVRFYGYEVPADVPEIPVQLYSQRAS